MSITAEKFIEENAGMIRGLAKRFSFETAKFSIEDLTQEGNMSVVRNISKYDIERGEAKLQTYLYQCIFRDLRDFVRKNKHDLFVSKYQQKKEYEEAVKSNSTDKNGNVSVDISNRMAPVSIDMAFNSDSDMDFSLPSGAPPAIDKMIREEQIDIMRQEIATLSDREQTIIKAKYLDGKSYNEIALDFNLTRQRIEQISNGALEKLRKTVVKKLQNDLYT